MPYLIYFLLLIPLNMILPASWGEENSVVENIQLVCLIAAAIMCYRYRNAELKYWGGSQKALCYAGTLFFFLLTMREISWGRVLLLHPDGRIYQYSEMGLYGQMVHPLVCILIALLLVLLYRSKFWKIFGLIKFPIKSFILLMLFVLMSWIGEKGEISIFHGNLSEELAELGVYLMMCKLVHTTFYELHSKHG